MPLGLQSRAKEAHRGVPIPSRLHEDVEDVTGLIHGAPQVLLATLDRDEHLVEMPGVAEPATAAPQSARIPASAASARAAARAPRSRGGAIRGGDATSARQVRGSLLPAMAPGIVRLRRRVTE